jgi:hypothetical protein
MTQDAGHDTVREEPTYRSLSGQSCHALTHVISIRKGMGQQ